MYVLAKLKWKTNRALAVGDVSLLIKFYISFLFVSKFKSASRGVAKNKINVSFVFINEKFTSSN